MRFAFTMMALLPSSIIGMFALPVFGEGVPAKVTFEEHIKPIFREHCSKCHNENDKKSGLSLDSFASTMAGGSGGELVTAGDLESSRLWALTAHVEQPKMPPNQDKIADAKLELLKRWILQGMPENDGSEIMAPKVDLSAMGAVSQSRPEGAPPMPTSVLKQTPLYTERAAAISALAASPWSPLIAVGGQEQVTLYHSQTGELLGILSFPEGEPQSITFSRDGKLILVGGGRHSQSGFAVLYDLQTGNRITRVGDELDIVMAADLSEDNSKIALGGPQKFVRVYDTATGKLIHELKKHTDWIYAVRFSPDGLLVASADRSNGLFVWESESGRLYLDLIGHKNEVRSVAWRPDSLALISASLDGTLKSWDMNGGKLIKSWDAHGGGVLAVAICNDGTIASTGKDTKVRVWTAAGDTAGEMPNLADAGMEVAISVDSQSVAAGDWQGNVRLWERANPKNEKLLRANPQTLEQSIAESEKSLPNFIAANAAEEKAWKEFEAKIATSKKSLTDSEQGVSAAKSQIDAKQNAANAVTKEVEAITAKTKSAELKLEADRTQLQEKANQLAVLKSKEQDTTAAETESTQLKSLIDEQEKTLSQIRQTLIEKNSAIAVIQSQIKDLSDAKLNLDKAVEVTRVAYQAIEKETPASKAKFDIAKAEVTKQQASIANLRKDLELFNKSKQQWASRSEEIQKQFAQLEQQRLVAQSSLEAEESNRKSALEKSETLKKQIEQLQQSIAQLENQNKQTEQTIAEKQATIESAGSQLGQLKAEHQTLTEQLQSYK